MLCVLLAEPVSHNAPTKPVTTQRVAFTCAVSQRLVLKSLSLTCCTCTQRVCHESSFLIGPLSWRGLGIASPPIKFPCYMGINIPSSEELVANNYDLDGLRELFGVDTIQVRFARWMTHLIDHEPNCIGMCTLNFQVLSGLCSLCRPQLRHVCPVPLTRRINRSSQPRNQRSVCTYLCDSLC